MTYQNFPFFSQIVSFWFIQLANDLPVCLLYILSPKPREYIQLSARPGQHLLSSLFFWMLQQGNLSSFCMLFAFHGNTDLPVSHVLRKHLCYESVSGFGEQCMWIFSTEQTVWWVTWNGWLVDVLNQIWVTHCRTSSCTSCPVSKHP